MVGNENKNNERSTIITIAGALFCLTTILLLYPIYFSCFRPVQTNGHTPDLSFLIYIPAGILLSLLSVFIRPSLSLLHNSKWIVVSFTFLYAIFTLYPFLYSGHPFIFIIYAFIFIFAIITGMAFIPIKVASIISIILGGMGVLIGIYVQVI